MEPYRHNADDLVWMSPDHFEILEFHLKERLSEPGTVVLTLRAAEQKDPYQLIGQSARFALASGEKLQVWRPFSGVISRVRQLRSGFGNIATANNRSYLYELELRAPIWQLSHSEDSRVFQNKTVRQIVAELLDQAGIAHRWDLAGTMAEREYCVQYCEKTLHFVHRLLESEGVYYFYDHDLEQMVFCDHSGAHPDAQPSATIRYGEGIRAKEKDDELLFSAAFDVKMGSGKVTCHDYRYTESQLKVVASADGAAKGSARGSEVYLHNTPQNSAIRGQAASASTTELVGEGNARSLACGHCFSMSGHYLEELNKRWLLREWTAEGRQGYFHVHYRAHPGDQAYRPPIANPNEHGFAQTGGTPIPKVRGLQTAVITGPPGSDVYLDELGRCKLQFHWDRTGEMNDRSSMWVRVANNYAGKDYGIQFIPRVGHEVLVEFLEGNPDHPVVVGRVYNDQQSAPLGPDQRYKNIIKTPKDHHITFDDSDGQELFAMRSQKDMNLLVLNNRSKTIGQDQMGTIGRDQTYSVGRNQARSIGVDQSLQVGRDQQTSVGVNRSLQVGQNQETAIGQDRSETVGQNQTLTVGQAQAVTVGIARAVTVGQVETQTVGVNQAITVGVNQANTVGVSRETTVGQTQMTTIGQAENHTVGVARSVTVGASADETVGATKSTKVGKTYKVKVGRMKSETVGLFSTETVGGGKTLTVGGAYACTVGGVLNTIVGLRSNERVMLSKKIKAGKKIELICGKSKLVLHASGTVVIEGLKLNLKGSKFIKAEGEIIDLN